MPSLDEAIARALAALQARQNPDGSFEGTCEFDPSCTALFVLLRHYLGRADKTDDREFARYLLHSRRPDGGWGGSPDSDADLDITALCYAALRATGLPPDQESMEKSRDRIASLGGLRAVGMIPRIVLRMLGQIPSSAVPHLSPRFLALPGWIRPNVADLGLMALGVVPCSLLHEPEVRPLPPERGIGELLGGNKTRWSIAPLRRPGQGRSSIGTSLAWRVLAGTGAVLRWLDRVAPARRGRARARHWLLDHQGREPHFLLPGVLHLMALDNWRDERAARCVDTCLGTMRSWIIRDCRGARVLFTPGTTHDTARALEALVEFPEARPSADRAASWLAGHQGDHAGFQGPIKNTESSCAGWCFGRRNPWLADTDDTAIVLNGLRPLRERHRNCYERGLDWLLSMQGREGGWAPYTRDAGFARWMPAGMLEPILASALGPDEDITARVLLALHPLANERDDPGGRIRRAVERAVDFLWARRRPDGSWFGHWVVHFAYGTAQAVEALAACGRSDDPRLEQSVRWLESLQDPDGGWGESKQSHRQGGFVPGPGNPLVTSFVARALALAGRTSPDVLRRAADFLLAAQQADGLWPDTGWEGVLVQGTSYARYDPTPFVIGALVRLRARLAAGDPLSARPPR